MFYIIRDDKTIKSSDYLYLFLRQLSFLFMLKANNAWSLMELLIVNYIKIKYEISNVKKMVGEKFCTR